MVTKLSEIKSSERVKINGDVHITGKIGRGAVVSVQDGNLIVDGDVEDGAQITLNQNGKRNFWRNSIIFTHDKHKLISIKGYVGSNVNIKALFADIEVDGNVGEHSQINTQNGNVNLNSAPPSVMLGSHYGNVLIGGVKRPHRAGEPSVYNSKGSLFVNGRDITRPVSHDGLDEEGSLFVGGLSGAMVGMVALFVVATVLSIPIMPGVFIFMGVVVAGAVIGGLIGGAVNHVKSMPSIEFPAHHPQQADQISNSSTKILRQMGCNTLVIHNEARAISGQQSICADKEVVMSPVEVHKEVLQRSLGL